MECSKEWGMPFPACIVTRFTLSNFFVKIYSFELRPNWVKHVERARQKFCYAFSKRLLEQLIMNSTNDLQLYRTIYCSQSALHVSGDILAHHQERLNVFTASGNIHQCRCQPAATLVNINP